MGWAMIAAASDSGAAPVAAPEDLSVIDALCRGDETAFARLGAHYYGVSAPRGRCEVTFRVDSHRIGEQLGLHLSHHGAPVASR
jgi:hypothetical protein